MPERCAAHRSRRSPVAPRRRPGDQDVSGEADSETPPEQQRILEAAREAIPYIEEAREAMDGTLTLRWKTPGITWRLAITGASSCCGFICVLRLILLSTFPPLFPLPILERERS